MAQQQKDTKGKSVSGKEINLHKQLAMNMPVETGAGKGPMGGSKGGKKTPA